MRTGQHKPSLDFPQREGRKASAFSLVEVLVATAVVGLLLVLMLQMVSSTGQTTSSSQRRIDSDTAGRNVFAVMGRDFSRAVKRPGADLDVIFSKQTGNDKIFFLSEAPGYSSPSQATQVSPLSLIGYRINSQFEIERLGKALLWEDSQNQPMFVRLNASGAIPATTLAGNWPAELGAPPDYNGTSDDYQKISGDIFRMEFCLMDRDGKLFLPDANWLPWDDANGDGFPNLNEVRAIIVAIASMDATSRLTVGNMGAVASALPDVTTQNLESAPPELMASIWKQALESPGFSSEAGISPSQAGQIRIYQHVFLLHEN
jgi:type II secretory pathway component PulJ